MSITITKIERQKKKKQRYSLFNENKFIIGISEESLLEFNIYSGIELSEEALIKIERKEKYIAIREQSWRFLSRRMHSKKELSDKLKAKGYKKEDIDKIILELENKNYLNDDSFARQVVTDEINIKKNGPFLIKNKLLKKGIENSLSSVVIDELYEEKIQLQNCQYLASKKIGSSINSDERSKRSKLANYLIQKGFSWDICNQVLSEMDIL
jgi:regulatory protein